MGIGTVIIKPTKFCNAQCTYCSAPPEVNGAPKWTDDQFRFYFDRLAPYLSPNALLLWHGGEPMLMGPDFYWRAWEHCQASRPDVRFSMQSNILGYDGRRWRDLLRGPFGGSISTSFDPDEKHREYKGSTELYSRIFWKRLEALSADGFNPKVLGTYTEETIGLADRMYDISLSWGARSFDVRVNYRYPAGRDGGMGEMILPETYGRSLVRLYDRWIADVPGFDVTPLDEMLRKTVGLGAPTCPWTRHCGGHFLGLEPNGDLYNCSEFADLAEEEYRFGNLSEHTIPQALASRAAAAARRRRVDVPVDCKSCRHFGECEGGCMRDAVLFGKGLGGKFHYCRSWMQVFDRIKELISSGEADGMLATRLGLVPTDVRRRMAA